MSMGVFLKIKCQSSALVVQAACVISQCQPLAFGQKQTSLCAALWQSKVKASRHPYLLSHCKCLAMTEGCLLMTEELEQYEDAHVFQLAQVGAPGFERLSPAHPRNSQAASAPPSLGSTCLDFPVLPSYVPPGTWLGKQGKLRLWDTFLQVLWEVGKLPWGRGFPLWICSSVLLPMYTPNLLYS